MKKTTWTLVKRKISNLKLYEFNPRDITEKGLEDLKKSIDKFGLAKPIVINTDNIIIGGHARYLVLKKKVMFIRSKIRHFFIKIDIIHAFFVF